MMPRFSIDVSQIKGFLDQEEGEALYHYCLQSSSLGPALEIGSYCGKSTVYLGEACRENHSTLYAIDHHRGSEEHQPGEGYHDKELFDQETGLMDSFSEFRKTIYSSGLHDTVVPIVSTSANVSRDWSGELGMVFIDGGHSIESAMKDYRGWSSHIRKGGILAIHDIFSDPAEGGQAPYEIMKLALASGLFVELDRVKTLSILKRI
ncbi:MAG: hypothetical protein CMQ40_03715 [Gammaproteobacteria bacterium]|nr:hypothetical protein [Gammaproteobacteria bacterium]